MYQNDAEMMLFTSETYLTARIAARGQEWPALKLPDNLLCAKITHRDYTKLFHALPRAMHAFEMKIRMISRQVMFMEVLLTN